MTKAAIKKRCSALLGKYKNKPVDNPEDLQFLLDILKGCSSWDEKNQGHNLVYIDVKTNLEHPTTNSFYLHFNDDFDGYYGEDISFLDSDYLISPKQRKEIHVRNACRTAEKDRTIELRTKCLANIPFICPKTSLKVYSGKQLDIHHEMSPNSTIPCEKGKAFNSVINVWIDAHGGYDKLYKCLNGSKGQGSITKFVDENLVADLKKFLEANLTLHPLSKPGHKLRYKELREQG